jgi:hypothetical protein
MNFCNKVYLWTYLLNLLSSLLNLSFPCFPSGHLLDTDFQEPVGLLNEGV